MTSVRAYEEQDRDAVLRLCLEDAGALEAGEDTQRYTTITKCEYYIDREPGNCFVAVDDDEGVIGCILCAGNTDEYERAFSEHYVPLAASISARRYVEAKLSLIPVTMYRKYYPSHVLMFVQNSWYGRGVGELLRAALKSQRRRKHMTKLMTVCDAESEVQIGFFEKHGFGRLIRTKYGMTMGLEIKD